MERFRATLIPESLDKSELKRGFKNGVPYEVTVLDLVSIESIYGRAKHWVHFADANGVIRILDMNRVHLISKDLAFKQEDDS